MNKLFRLMAATAPLAVCSAPAVAVAPAGSAPPPALVAKAILARCASAYDHLHSYRCRTSVTRFGSSSMPASSTADIAFVRPANIRVHGLDTGGQHYTLFANGGKAELYCNGGRQEEPDAETAIAGVTGIAYDAPTIVPALLLHSN